ncbi:MULTISPECIES: hypothetical protein [Exiguobacterium]|uniref:hypothetical protein n=1 Tax=Exiguobacterium TaxID=33986 RepID=UPI0011874682|nr:MULTISPECIES: hypothetical protein [Exiguobacterium]
MISILGTFLHFSCDPIACFAPVAPQARPVPVGDFRTSLFRGVGVALPSEVFDSPLQVGRFVAFVPSILTGGTEREENVKSMIVGASVELLANEKGVQRKVESKQLSIKTFA